MVTSILFRKLCFNFVCHHADANNRSTVKKQNTDTGKMNNNNLNITDMQTTLFDLDLFVTVKAHVTVKKQSSRKVSDSDVNWGDIYDNYEDFDCTSQSWS